MKALRRALTLLVLALALPAPAQDLTPLILRVAPAVAVISDEGAGSGSGFVVSRDGRIVTSLHVIARMRQPRVTLASGEAFTELTVQGYDRERDIAILKVDARNLPALRLGDSAKVTVGQRVVAFGTPLGLSGTATAGIVSAVRVHPRLSGATLLQTDAAINPGNSGGPLVDGQGRAVGVVVSVIRSAQNLGFAVPANDLRALLRSAEGMYTLDDLRRYLLATDWAGQVLARRWRADGGALYELEGSGESLRLTFLRPPEEARLGARLTLSLLRKGAGYEGLATGEVNCETLRESRRVPWLQEAAAIRALALDRLEVSYRAPATPDPEGDCKLAFRSHSLTLVPASDLEAAPATGEPEYIDEMRKRRAEHLKRRALMRDNCREVHAKLARDCAQVNEWSAPACKTFSDLAGVCTREGF
jgi:hypothetical protein